MERKARPRKGRKGSSTFYGCTNYPEVLLYTEPAPAEGAVPGVRRPAGAARPEWDQVHPLRLPGRDGAGAGGRYSGGIAHGRATPRTPRPTSARRRARRARAPPHSPATRVRATGRDPLSSVCGIHLQAQRGLTPYTVRNYLTDLLPFWRFLDDRDVRDLSTLDRPALRTIPALAADGRAGP